MGKDERLQLQSLVHQAGWKVLLGVIDGEVKRAESACLSTDPLLSDVVLSHHRRAGAIRDFSVWLVDKVWFEVGELTAE